MPGSLFYLCSSTHFQSLGPRLALLGPNWWPEVQNFESQQDCVNLAATMTWSKVWAKTVPLIFIAFRKAGPNRFLTMAVQARMGVRAVVQKSAAKPWVRTCFHVPSTEHQTTNLGVRGSNPFGRASFS